MRVSKSEEHGEAWLDLCMSHLHAFYSVSVFTASLLSHGPDSSNIVIAIGFLCSIKFQQKVKCVGETLLF